MEWHDVISVRREITSFLDKPIEKQIINQLIDDVCLAPTGNNLPSREFIVVQNRETLTSLANATPFVKWLEEARAAVVITGRPDISKYWIQDASISASYIWLSAVNVGLGCAFGAILNTADEKESHQRESYVKDVLSIPEDRRVVAVLGLGYEKDKPKKKSFISKNDIVHFGSFSTR